MTDKYGRTYHLPFSPGVTNDDRVNKDWFEDVKVMSRILWTEKLDGENTCLSRNGVYARSHAAPTTSPWSKWIRNDWSQKSHDIDEDIEIFGENLEGIHSIEYRGLKDSFFYVFAVRDNTRQLWLSWDEVEFYAKYFGYPTVPILMDIDFGDKEMSLTKFSFEDVEVPISKLNSHDPVTGDVCTAEGYVLRNYYEFPCEKFKNNVMKYVRAGHVQTDEHWTKHWRRATLLNERQRI